MLPSDAPPTEPELPPIDERLIIPETRYEILDGVLVYVPPADEFRGNRHSRIATLIRAHAAPDFLVAIDMLTRTSETSDIAFDVSVFPRARDPATGGRQIEHLAFELVNAESLSYVSRKAAQFAARGVRRVFAIDLEQVRVLEWSRSCATWDAIETSPHIDDLALAVPLPIEDLLGADKVDNAVARALIAKRNPVIEAARAEHIVRARNRGCANALLTILSTRGISLSSADSARILGERNTELLDLWVRRAASCTNAAELFEGYDRLRQSHRAP